MRVLNKSQRRGARGTNRGRGRTEADNAADAPPIDDSDCEGCEHCTPAGQEGK